MVKMNSSSFVVSLAILIFGLSGLPLTAQQREEFQPRNVISANPFGLLLDLFNAEYERLALGDPPLRTILGLMNLNPGSKLTNMSTLTCSGGFTQAVTAPGRTTLLSDGHLVRRWALPR